MFDRHLLERDAHIHTLCVTHYGRKLLDRLKKRAAAAKVLACEDGFSFVSHFQQVQSPLSFSHEQRDVRAPGAPTAVLEYRVFHRPTSISDRCGPPDPRSRQWWI